MKRQKMKNNRETNITLSSKLRGLLLSLFIPMLILIFFLLAVQAYFAAKYDQISHNISVSSELSLNFKDNLDLEMYYYAIGNEQQTLPTYLVDEVVELGQSLQSTTSRQESQKALNNLLSYCQNLKKRMKELAQTENYDSRMLQLENNIRILTKLIQGEIEKYLYYEAGHLANIEKRLMWNMKLFIVGMGIVIILMGGLLIRRAMRFANDLSQPISQIVRNVQMVGKGNFQIAPAQTHDKEVEVLNEGIMKMARRIDDLLKKEIKEQEEKRLTELQLLQAQVNPHFLYNTLDTIVWMVESGDQQGAIELVDKLSTFSELLFQKGMTSSPCVKRCCIPEVIWKFRECGIRILWILRSTFQRASWM